MSTATLGIGVCVPYPGSQVGKSQDLGKSSCAPCFPYIDTAHVHGATDWHAEYKMQLTTYKENMLSKLTVSAIEIDTGRAAYNDQPHFTMPGICSDLPMFCLLGCSH